MIVGVALLLASTLMGFIALRHLAAEQQRIQSARTLRAVWFAMLMYANDSRDHQFPDSLLTLLDEQDLTPDLFVYPGSADTPATGETRRKMLASFATPGHCSYLYFGKGLPDNGDLHTVVECERLMKETADGMNVLFLDGHTEYVSGAAAQQLRTALASGGPIAWSSTGGPTRPATQPTTPPIEFFR